MTEGELDAVYANTDDEKNPPVLTRFNLEVSVMVMDFKYTYEEAEVIVMERMLAEQKRKQCTP